jgi:tRNA-specific 2-thiouridylase
MKQITAVALSGGVDSLMAACLLKEQGHQIVGIHFITGFETDASGMQPPIKVLSQRIHDIGAQLGITVKIVDVREEFREKIIAYFVRSYRRGRTPNPCMRCNPTIKFGTILSRAREFGVRELATGHYARIKRDEDGNPHLLKGLDNKKDQSYFLARLTGRQLAAARFPLGEMNKSVVKNMAIQKGLRPVVDAESQDICFIRHDSYGNFLRTQEGFEPRPGIIEDMSGNVIGKHNGLHLFTIGQRRGINCPAAEPYYVVRLDPERNRLTVGTQKDLLSSECTVVDINWIGREPASPIMACTRVRYRSEEVPSTVIPLENQAAVVRFKNPQPAVTPGQGAVFYIGDEILGGGWIEENMKTATQRQF